MNKVKHGKFIIIEGTDGAGKTTQLELLRKWFEDNGYRTKTLDFPQYGQFWGNLVGRFLKGEFGELSDINPYLASLPYLLDQATQSKNIKNWLKQGYYVLSNRYVTSSMGHQTAKFLNLKNFANSKFHLSAQAGISNFKLNKEALDYLEWLQKAAYEELKLVREDMTILLYAEPRITLELSKKAMNRKSYAQGRDIAEEDMLHQLLSANTFKLVAEKIDTWKFIDCMKDEKLDSIENIYNEILKVVKTVIS